MNFSKKKNFSIRILEMHLLKIYKKDFKCKKFEIALKVDLL